jgi:hypothetical protein
MLSTAPVHGKETHGNDAPLLPRLCHHCGRDIGPLQRVGRRDACLHCGSDLHCCLNCSFFEPSCHNQCREPEAERQVDKHAGNFCDYFSFRRGPRPTAGVSSGARAQLDALFKKKK